MKKQTFHFHIGVPQLEELRKLAVEKDESVSKMIRKGIDLYIETQKKPGRKQRQQK